MTKTHRASAAARACNTDARTIGRLVGTGVIRMRTCDTKSDGSGTPNQFSRRRVLQIALLQELTSVGVALSVAANASLKFSDEGSPSRFPGELFPHGLTLLISRTSGWEVINVLHDADYSALSDYGTALIAVDCGRVCKHVDAILQSN